MSKDDFYIAMVENPLEHLKTLYHRPLPMLYYLIKRTTIRAQLISGLSRICYPLLHLFLSDRVLLGVTEDMMTLFRIM